MFHLTSVVPFITSVVPFIRALRVLSPATAVCLSAVLFATGQRARATEAIRLLPNPVSLHGLGARQTLLIAHLKKGQPVGDLAGDVRITTSDAKVVRLDGRVAIATGDGHASITVEAGPLKVTVPAVVTGANQPVEWEFRNHVQSVFAKAGCNSGACHGALAGKGGLKLSLRGYDTLRDYVTLTRQARGRRIELADPGRSLILAKPTGAIPHKGGVRFEVGSADYEVISSWIASGATPPTDEDPRLERLEILPESSLLPIDAKQPLLVRAFFTNGRVEDVTRWAKFTSTNETVAKVDSEGMIRVVGHGEGAVTAWYLSKIVVARVTSPYDSQGVDEAIAGATRHNFIDDLILDKLGSLRLRPSPPANEATFLRRVYVDTIGRLPTPTESRRFFVKSSPAKREQLIDYLLASPEFVDYWTYKWSDLLLLTSERLRPAARNAYYDWIRESVAQNKPWDQFAREIITSRGSSVEQGETNFFSLHQGPLEMAENTTVAFLGLNINCARCHNHPLEKWTNDQYYAMANLFARVRAKGWAGDSRSGDGKREVYVVPEGDLIQPLTGQPQPPAPLDGEPLPFESTLDRRVYLAEWLTSPTNPYFSRAITNRVWANFFGVGLVEMIDDMRTSNPPSNELLLSECAEYLVDHDFDLKALIRSVLQSASYQRSSLPHADNRDDTRFYSRYYPRRMMAEVLLDAISDVTGVPTEFTEIRYGAGGVRQATTEYPAGTRAVQLRDSAVNSYFLSTFGRNERLITCECLRSNQPSMVQVLHLANGNTLNQKLAAEKGHVTAQLTAGATDEQIIDEIYLRALSRYPSTDERTKLLEIVTAASPEDRRTTIEDLYWGILSSREFLFNH